MKTILNLLLTLALAIAVAYLGGLSRPYNAFGGEDMLAIVIAVGGIYSAVQSRKGAKHGKV